MNKNIWSIIDSHWLATLTILLIVSSYLLIALARSSLSEPEPISDEELFVSYNVSSGSLRITESFFIINAINSTNFYNASSYKIKLSEKCTQVPCECADWGCVSYCYICEKKGGKGK